VKTASQLLLLLEPLCRCGGPDTWMTVVSLATSRRGGVAGAVLDCAQ